MHIFKLLKAYYQCIFYLFSVHKNAFLFRHFFENELTNFVNDKCSCHLSFSEIIELALYWILAQTRKGVFWSKPFL